MPDKISSHDIATVLVEYSYIGFVPVTRQNQDHLLICNLPVVNFSDKLPGIYLHRRALLKK